MATTNLLTDIATEATQERVLAKLDSTDSPMQAEMAGIFKRLFAVFGRLSFAPTSALRVQVENNITTLTTLTTGNMSTGDWGKNATAQSQSALAFHASVGKNFVR